MSHKNREMDSFPELKNFYLNKYKSDITILIDGNQIPAHKFILLANSKVFDTMFSANFTESTEKIIEIRETSLEAFKHMLYYFYCGEFVLNEKNDYLMAIEVFRLSHRFEVKRLLSIIEKSLLIMINKIVDRQQDLGYPKELIEEWAKYKRDQNYAQIMRFFRFNTKIINIIDDIGLIYEFAVLYELNELIEKCLNKLLLKYSYLIIAKQSFICQNMDVMESMLEVMDLTNSMLINALKVIRDHNPQSDLKRFEKFIYFRECSVDDIRTLRNIKLFNDDLLFEVMAFKCDQLINKNKCLHKIVNDNTNAYKLHKI